MLRPGAHVDRYELVRRIGEDGVTEQWVARQHGKASFEKLFTLEAVQPRWAADPAFRARFLDEARRAAAIDHPNVAQVFDLGESDGVLYLVRENIDGESVAGAAVPVPIAVRIAIDVCAGLHAAHRTTVHGDVSPKHVYVSVRGDVKLAGFGVARAAVGDRAVGPQADVVGAGATLAAMLGGRATAPIAAILGQRFATAQELGSALEATKTAASAAEIAEWAQRRAEPPAAGFMDVGAIVARANERMLEPDDDGAPVQARPFVPAESGAKRPEKKRLLTPKVLAIVAGLVVVSIVAAIVAAPSFVRDRVIARAHEAGVELEIGRVSVGFGGISLGDVSVRVPSVPALSAVHLDGVDVVGFSGREVHVSGLDAKLDGPVQAVLDALLRFADQNRRLVAGTATDPNRFVLVSGRFTWTNAFGAGTAVEAGELGADVDSRGAGLENIKASIARFDVKTSRTVFGPWSLAYERSPQSARARVLFDPPLMDGPSAMVLFVPPGETQVTIHVPRSAIAHLGIKPEDLSLPADSATEVDADLDAKEDSSGKVTGKGKVDLWAARVKGTRGPVDIHAEGTASGLSGKPLVLDKTQIAVGPFVADVDGTIDASWRGVRVDAKWRTRPIACATFVRAEASKLGSIVEALHDLVERTGAARVTGNAYATGLLRYDTDVPSEVSVTWIAKETCGLSIFGL